MGLLEDLRDFYGEPPSRAARRPAIDPSMPLLAQLNSFYGGPPGMRSILEDEEEEDPQEKLRRLAQERIRRMKEEGDEQAERLGLHGPVAVPGSEEDPGHMAMIGAGAKEGLRAVGLGTAQLALTGGEVASQAMRGDLAGAIGSLITENVAERWMRQKSEAMRKDFEETREAYLVADPELTDPDRPAHKLSPRQALALASEVAPQAVEALIPYGAAVKGARGALRGSRAVTEGAEAAGKLTREAAAELARKSVRPTAGNDPEVLGDALQVLKREMATGKVSEEEATERLLRLGRLEAQVTDPHLGDLQRASLAIGEDASTVGAAQSPRSTKALPYDLDDEGRRLVDVPEGSFTEPETPFQFNPHKLDLSLEMKAMLPEVVERNIKEFQKRGSGVVKPWSRLENVEELARKLGTTVDDLKGRTGAMTDEELAIINAATSGAGQKVHRLTRAALDNPDDAVLKIQRDAALAEFEGLLAVSAGAASEAGRALNAQKKLYLALGAESAERMKLAKKYRSRMTEEGERLLASIDPTNVDELMAFLAHVNEPGVGQMLHTYWISSILSGVGTQGRNIIGNTGMLLNEAIVAPATAAVELARPLVGKGGREVFFRESVAGLAGVRVGAARGMQKGLRALRYGYYDEGSKFVNFTRNPWLVKAKAMEQRGARGAKAVKAAGTAIDLPFRGLSGMDIFFRSVAETMAATRLATRHAIKQGARGAEIGAKADELVRAMPEWLAKEVSEFGRKMTFTDEVSDVTKAVLNLRDKPVLGPAIKVFAPFARIADRINARGFEMTPVGLVKTAYKLKAEGWTSEVSELTARAGIGSGIMMGATAYGINGNLTAWAPRDAAERDAFYRSGRQPWSIKIGSKWVPFAQMEPFSYPLAMAAIAVDAAREDKPIGEDRLLAGIVGIGAFLKDKSWLEGFEQVTNLMSGDYRSIQGIKSVYRSLGGLVWPSGMLRNVSTLWDEGKIRQPEEVWDYLIGNIPGSKTRGSLPVRLDTRGRPVAKQAPARSLFGGTPIAFTEEDYGDLIDREFRRHGLNRTYAGRTLGGKRLSDDEWRRYHKRSAEIIDMRLRQIFDSPAYWGRPDEQKKLINRAVRRGRRDARDELGL